jgi:hypothetical protein
MVTRSISIVVAPNVLAALEPVFAFMPMRDTFVGSMPAFAAGSMTSPTPCRRFV